MAFLLFIVILMSHTTSYPEREILMSEGADQGTPPSEATKSMIPEAVPGSAGAGEDARPQLHPGDVLDGR